MSASDEAKSDAQAKSDARAKPVDDAEAVETPVLEHAPAASVEKSPFMRKLRLYGVLLAVVLVSLLAGAASYPYWRAEAETVLARVGLDLGALEARLEVPGWAITHGREASATPAATSAAKAGDTKPASVSLKSASKSPLTAQPDAAPTPVPTPDPAKPTPVPAMAAWSAATEALADRLAEVETRLLAIEGRLEALEQPAGDGRIASANDPSPSSVPSDLVEQLGAIAGRLANVEARQDQSTAPNSVAAPATDGSALIGTVIRLAERVAAVENRATVAPDDVAALRENSTSLATRIAGLDAQIKQLGAALDEDTPARDRAALVLLSVSQLAVATSGPRPYLTQLDALRSVAGGEARLAQPLEQLAAHAATGVSTLALLRVEFSETSKAAIRSRDVGSPEGVLGQTLSRVASLVTIRKVDSLGADTVDGALAATDAALGLGDLASAVAILEALDGAPGEAVAGWLSDARARLEVDGALLDLQAAALSALAVAG
ncbi:MAG: mitofilin family membrane protein [Proteobacteria bacterium]|nr:mitofilin family membrane protein [Pseudomonadota bacterium]